MVWTPIPAARQPDLTPSICNLCLSIISAPCPCHNHRNTVGLLPPYGGATGWIRLVIWLHSWRRNSGHEPVWSAQSVPGPASVQPVLRSGNQRPAAGAYQERDVIYVLTHGDSLLRESSFGITYCAKRMKGQCLLKISSCEGEGGLSNVGIVEDPSRVTLQDTCTEGIIPLKSVALQQVRLWDSIEIALHA